MCGLAFVCLAASARAEEPLRYKFKQGEVIAYALEYKIGAGVNRSNVTAQLNYDAGWTVTAVDAEGKANITQKIGHVRFLANGPGGQTRFDSQESKEAAAGTGQMAASMVPFLNAFPGAEITLTVDPRGAVSDVTLPQKIQDGLREMRGGPGTGEAFSLGGFKRLISQPMQPLPSGPAAKGQTWEHADEFRMRSGNMKIDVKYTYEGPATRNGKQLERVAVQPTMSIGKGRIAAKATIKAQKASGAFYFDPAAGRLVEFSLTQDVDQEVLFTDLAVPQQAHTYLATAVKMLDKAK